MGLARTPEDDGAEASVCVLGVWERLQNARLSRSYHVKPNGSRHESRHANTVNTGALLLYVLITLLRETP